MRSARLIATLALAVAVLTAACERGDEPPPPTPTATPGVVATAPPTPTATVLPTPPPTPSPEPAAAQTATPTPTPTPTATVEPTPQGTPAPDPTPAPTTAAKPTPEPKPPPRHWQPAIHEIETDHDALGRVFFERGDEMELELRHAFGLFFLDVGTGGVEGWTWPEPLLPSPGNRFVYFPSDETPVLYDRLTERSYTWDPDEMTLMRAAYSPSHLSSLLGWGTDAGEHLVFGSGSDYAVGDASMYAVIDASMHAVASFEFTEAVGLFGGWAHPNGTHLLMRSAHTGDDRLYSVHLRAGMDAKIRTRTSPRTERGSRVQVSNAGDGFALISRSDEGTCSVERLDWTLSTLSDVSLPCDPWRGIDLSPDGRLAATVLLSVGEAIAEPGLFSRLTTVSIFDAATGEERLRIKGALFSDALFSVHRGRTRWLSDGSGLALDTRDDTRIVRLEDEQGGVFAPDAHWWWGLLIPGPDRADRLDRPFALYLAYCAAGDDEDSADGRCRVLRARVVDDAGGEIASARVTLRIAPGSAWDVGRGSIDAVAYDRTSWV